MRTLIGVVTTASAVAIVITGVAFFDYVVTGKTSAEPRPGGSAVVPCGYAWDVQGVEESSQDVWFTASDCSESPVAVDPEIAEYDPATSPDGATVAFVREIPGSGPAREIVGASTADFADQTIMLTTPRLAGGLDWSDDGRQLAYWQDDGHGHPGIWVLDLASGTATLVAQGDTAYAQPSLAPTGRDVAFVMASPTGGRLGIAELADRGESRVLEVANNSLKFPTWAPSGEELAAVDYVSGDIVTFDVASERVEARIATPSDLTPVGLKWTQEGFEIVGADANGERSAWRQAGSDWLFVGSVRGLEGDMAS